MFNAKVPLASIELDVFGGLFTEASPPDLPPGASPLTVNSDFPIGSTDIRPGKHSFFSFTDFFSEKNAGFAQSIAGPFAPNEQAWIAPLNVTLNIPGTYTAVSLNTGGGSFPAQGQFDNAVTATGNSGTVAVSGSPSAGGELALLFTCGHALAADPNPGAGWTALDTSSFSPAYSLYSRNLVDTSLVSASFALGTSTNWATALAFFGSSNGLTPVIRQSQSIASGGVGTGNFTGALGVNTLAGSGVIVVLASSNLNSAYTATVTDSQGNIYVQIASASIGSAATGAGLLILFAPNVAAAACSITVHITAGSATANIEAYEIQGIGTINVSTAPVSQILQCINYPFSIPAGQNIVGLQLEVSGHQTDLSADSILTAVFLNPDGTTGSESMTFQLPLVDGTTTIGSTTFNWGVTLSSALLNNPNTGIRITASASKKVSFDLYAAKLKAWLTPNPPPSFNYLKSFERPAGEVLNLALGSDGIIFQEDAINNPGALTGVYTAIQANSFAQSITQSGREFIAISNLINGTDIPYSYDGTNFDRLSQVGPGAPPTCTATSSGSPIVSITQNPAVPLLTGAHDWLLCSDSPSDQGTFGTPATPGNVFTLVFRSATTVPAYITPGSGIVLKGFPAIKGNQLNNDPTGVNAPAFYVVTSVGKAIPGQQSYDAITFTVRFTTFFNSPTPAGCSIESTIATMTTAVQVPNLEVGNQFQVNGTGGAPPAGYDNTWTVLTTPNAAQLQITSTQLASNVATYGFTLISGTTPAVGQAVTVTQTLNGNGVFNITQGIISAASAGSFSVNIVNPDVSSTGEAGSGIIFGTIFTFDAQTIVGNKSGGSVVASGLVAAGQRKICYSYLTRNGLLTQPSPVATFDVPSGSSAIAVANLLPGPSNVIARVISLTAAEGGNFYNIPTPVTVTSNGIVQVNTSTWVLDNTTTNVLLSFSDAVLLGASASQIDVQGNNLFETVELGSSLMLLPYASRLFAIGEQLKVPNFVNWSFDGGIGVVQSTAGAGGGTGGNATFPAGWTVDPVNGGGVSVIASPIFGGAFSIQNSTGSTQATYGMITQGAYQDEFNVPIIQASTTYSVRVTAALPTGASTGQFVVDLFSPAIARSVGTATLQFSALTSNMQIETLTLLTTTLAPVPKDLLLRLYATNILNGVQVTVDRIEVFPTESPTRGAVVIGSYIDNFESFDQVSGLVDTSVENQQPVRSGFVLFGEMYLVKTHSIVASRDVDGLEPNNWNTPRVISKSIGTPSIYGVAGSGDTGGGEEWAIVAGEEGAYLFNGGQPIELTPEIKSLWNLINWKHGETLWVQNDVINRRMLFGVPMRTIDDEGNQNTWLPEGVVPDNANPTTPNVILAMYYKMLTTAGEITDRVGVHPVYTGQLKSGDYVRKWTIWSIKAPCAAFLTQANTTQPLFVGNSDGDGAIYDFVNGQLFDDSVAGPVAIDQQYYTYGFPSNEQAESMNLGLVRKYYDMMTALLDGSGTVNITIYPNSLDSTFQRQLLPDFDLPISDDGDGEIPVDESATRLFVRYRSNAVGSGFALSKMVMMARQESKSPVRGRNR